MLLDAESFDGVDLKKTYWIPYNKGGDHRKWYGLQDYVINWFNGPEDKTRGRKTFSKYYLKEYAAWSYTVTSSIAVRYYLPGFLWDVRGSGFFGKTENVLYFQGMVSSKVGLYFFKIDSSVMSCQVENILSMPLIIDEKRKDNVIDIVNENISISNKEWDEFETSWNYRHHPLLNTGSAFMKIFIADKYNNYKIASENRFNRMKDNEEKLNSIFIDIYGLKDELSPEVEEKDITLRKADKERDIKSLISYAIGCIMGRYSLKEDGLIYAGGEWNDSRYSDDFKPCKYGVMPITEEQYFPEDLCTRVIDFIKVVYGDEALNENLNFIANALKPGATDTPKQVLRQYLFNDFFNDHYQIYQHRPIYWQMYSGKAGGFRAIIYMHRYNENTLPLIRTEYLQDLRYKYEEELQRLRKKETDATTTADRNKAKKASTALDKKIVECAAYDDLLNHATSNISQYLFDLDDGVKTNYAKFLYIDGDKTKNILSVIKL